MKYSQETIKHFIFEEGFKLESYKDTAGYWTIGIGRMLGRSNAYRNIKISKDQAYQYLEEDLDIALEDCEKIFKNYHSHPRNVKLALLDMSYNLGYNKLSKFVKSIRYINDKDYKKAAVEILDSNWARNDVPNRARRVSNLIKSEA